MVTGVIWGNAGAFGVSGRALNQLLFKLGRTRPVNLSVAGRSRARSGAE
jgi:hypothetical protein